MGIKEQRPLEGGRTAAKIGPSDTSDTLSDRPGEPDTDSDAAFTGERASAGRDPGSDLNVELRPDRVVDATEAGLGAGLDAAEEAQLGVTDEELQDAAAEETRRPVKNRKP